ncbi:hypothetical protein [uncultured Fibrella sp.]|uniref:PBECR3 domain-containing polyvalent protein n=1 Tax=uncultured Fibrella sp. TaxID=1284596 RepID=UPI0035CA9E7B
MTEDLSEFITYCLSPNPPENKQIVLGPIPLLVIEKVLLDSGIDLTDYVFTIDVYAIRHIMKSHGNKLREEARGQKAITVYDFNLLHGIVSQPDIVFYDGLNRIGRDVLQFQKRIGDLHIILKEVRTGKKQLALNSMRIIKAKWNQG